MFSPRHPSNWVKKISIEERERDGCNRRLINRENRRNERISPFNFIRLNLESLPWSFHDQFSRSSEVSWNFFVSHSKRYIIEINPPTYPTTGQNTSLRAYTSRTRQRAQTALLSFCTAHSKSPVWKARGQTRGDLG